MSLRGAVVAVIAAFATTGAALAADPIPTPIGVTPEYRLPARGPTVEAGKPAGGLVCSSRVQPRFGVHLELFARRLVLIVPAGIGIAPPLVRNDGAFVAGGRCSYAVRTREPTGVIEVARGANATLGTLFEVWGQPLSRTRLAGFRAKPGEGVLAFVAGKPWRGDPRAIPLRRHAQIVLQIGGFVPPHVSYLFPKGL